MKRSSPFGAIFFKPLRQASCLSLLLAVSLSAHTFAAPAKAGDANCPPLGWSENLGNFLKPDAQMPTNISATASDCDFHEWSWEAFIWATALNSQGVPRFMTFPTPNDLLSQKRSAGKLAIRPLRLATRSLHGGAKDEVAGAIVEADGNMMVAQNGYPVLASVHMNPAYFAVAKNNMVDNGDYMKNWAKDDYFPVGSAVIKATWLRLDPGEAAPAGAFTTQAQVPVLTLKDGMAVPVKDKFVTATVALVGMHVVGETENHPEFLWGTFEHKLNAPMVPDNTFSPSMTPSSSAHTFYQANTLYANVNTASNQSPPGNLHFNEQTQKFAPATNVVQENKTGGESFSPNGPQNIANLNSSSQSFLSNQSKAEQAFASYNLIGTVWMKPNSYVTQTPQWWTLGSANAVGSVNLANSTAETFQQYPTFLGANGQADMSKVQNCFMCHNPTSYTAPLAARRIAISHVLAGNGSFAVANQIPAVAAACQDVSAGPIWNNQDAQGKCPAVCSAKGLSWNGQWTTTKPGEQSVCGCCGQ